MCESELKYASPLQPSYGQSFVQYAIFRHKVVVSPNKSQYVLINNHIYNNTDPIINYVVGMRNKRGGEKKNINAAIVGIFLLTKVKKSPIIKMHLFFFFFFNNPISIVKPFQTIVILLMTGSVCVCVGKRCIPIIS